MLKKIRWGILSTGRIAKVFARGLKFLPDAELVAVGSRTISSAKKFGAEFQIPRCHGSYQALVADPAVDIIYVATPHNLHRENSLLCLKAGKAVLCEKPFTINAGQAKTVIDFARQKRLFLMEAMWTRFIPAITKVRELVAQGIIGEVRMITADFGFHGNFEEEGRLFNPAYGGGALLDVGIYPLSFASMILGTPTKITSLAHLGQTGVDEAAAIILEHAPGQLAVLTTAIRIDTPVEATIMGCKGRIRIHPPFIAPNKITISQTDKPDQVIEIPYDGNGYNYQAAEAMRCLRTGKTESEIMPLDESYQIMQTMDKMRAQWGLKYPME